MPASSFILVSPGAIDGYPPVQYQARLLAEAGHAVTVVTTALGQAEPAFAAPGVRVQVAASGGGRVLRITRFIRALWAARRAAGKAAIEISYDPIGLFYSDLTPSRPKRRIAHFHELLQYPDLFLERRLPKAIAGYDLVVVADAQRAPMTQATLGLSALPLVLENYPLRATTPLPGAKGETRFEVVYCGALGLNQKLDTVIHSLPAWPVHADLVLIGNADTPTAQGLRTLSIDLGVAERVRFIGWLDTPAAEARMEQSDLGMALLYSGYEQLRTALGASNKRYQYMKAGLPQIGDHNPGVPELLEGIGACVQEHSPEAIAALVTAYANDPARCAAEGAEAFERHRAQYNYETVFQRLLNRVQTW